MRKPAKNWPVWWLSKQRTMNRRLVNCRRESRVASRNGIKCKGSWMSSDSSTMGWQVRCDVIRTTRGSSRGLRMLNECSTVLSERGLSSRMPFLGSCPWSRLLVISCLSKSTFAPNQSYKFHAVSLQSSLRRPTMRYKPTRYRYCTGSPAKNQ